MYPQPSPTHRLHCLFLGPRVASGTFLRVKHHLVEEGFRDEKGNTIYAFQLNFQLNIGRISNRKVFQVICAYLFVSLIKSIMINCLLVLNSWKTFLIGHFVVQLDNKFS